MTTRVLAVFVSVVLAACAKGYTQPAEGADVAALTQVSGASLADTAAALAQIEQLVGVVPGGSGASPTTIADVLAGLQRARDAIKANETTLGHAIADVGTQLAGSGTISERAATVLGGASTCSTDLATASASFSTCSTDLTTASTGLSTCSTGLATANTNLDAANTSLATCTTDVATANASLATANTSLTACTTDLAAATTNLATANTNLATANSSATALLTAAGASSLADVTTLISNLETCSSTSALSGAKNALCSNAGYATLLCPAGGSGSGGEFLIAKLSGLSSFTVTTAAALVGSSVTVVGNDGTSGQSYSVDTSAIHLGDGTGGTTAIAAGGTVVLTDSASGSAITLVNTSSASITSASALAAGLADTLRVGAAIVGNNTCANLATADTSLAACTTGLATANTNLDAANTSLATCTTDVATANASLSSCTSSLATDDTNLATCSSSLSTCGADLSAAGAASATCASDLSTADASLTSCTADLSTSGSSLTACTSNLSTSNTSLATCTTDLATVNTSLATANSSATALLTAAGASSLADVTTLIGNLETCSSTSSLSNAKSAICTVSGYAQLRCPSSSGGSALFVASLSGLSNFTVASAASDSSGTVTMIVNDGSAGQSYSVGAAALPIASGATVALSDGAKTITLVNTSGGSITTASALATALAGTLPVGTTLVPNSCANLATTNATLATTNATLATTDASLATCSSDLSAAGATGAACASDLSASNASLSSCTSSLATDDTNLATCSSSLSTCDADLSTSSSSLTACTSDLSTANASLTSAANDANALLTAASASSLSDVTALISNLETCSSTSSLSNAKSAICTVSGYAQLRCPSNSGGSELFVASLSGLSNFTVASAASNSSGTVTMIVNDGSAGQSYSVSAAVLPIASGATVALSDGAKTITLVNTSGGSITTANALAAALADTLPAGTTLVPNSCANLATTNATLATTNATLAITNATLVATDASLATCTTDIATADTSLSACTTGLSAANTNLDAANTSLATCTTDVATANASLSSCTSSLATDDTSLATCSSSLATCASDLSTADASLTSCDADLSTSSSSLTACTSNLSTANASLTSATSAANALLTVAGASSLSDVSALISNLETCSSTSSLSNAKRAICASGFAQLRCPSNSGSSALFVATLSGLTNFTVSSAASNSSGTVTMIVNDGTNGQAYSVDTSAIPLGDGTSGTTPIPNGGAVVLTSSGGGKTIKLINTSGGSITTANALAAALAGTLPVGASLVPNTCANLANTNAALATDDASLTSCNMNLTAATADTDAVLAAAGASNLADVTALIGNLETCSGTSALAGAQGALCSNSGYAALLCPSGGGGSANGFLVVKLNGLTNFTVTAAASTPGGNTVNMAVNDDNQSGITYVADYSSPIPTGGTVVLSSGPKSITLLNTTGASIGSVSELATALAATFPAGSTLVQNNTCANYTAEDTSLAAITADANALITLAGNGVTNLSDVTSVIGNIEGCSGTSLFNASSQICSAKLRCPSGGAGNEFSIQTAVNNFTVFAAATSDGEGGANILVNLNDGNGPSVYNVSTSVLPLNANSLLQLVNGANVVTLKNTSGSSINTSDGLVAALASAFPTGSSLVANTCAAAGTANRNLATCNSTLATDDAGLSACNTSLDSLTSDANAVLTAAGSSVTDLSSIASLIASLETCSGTSALSDAKGALCSNAGYAALLCPNGGGGSGGELLVTSLSGLTNFTVTAAAVNNAGIVSMVGNDGSDDQTYGVDTAAISLGDGTGGTSPIPNGGTVVLVDTDNGKAITVVNLLAPITDADTLATYLADTFRLNAGVVHNSDCSVASSF
jgi:hypothetical protein